MKKLYFLSALTLGFTAGAHGQEAKRACSKTRSIVIQESNLSQITRSGNRSVLWSDDFSDPSTWVIGNDAGNSDDWVVGTTVPSGSFAIPGIQSATAANGFALFDSDALCSGNQDAWIQTAVPVDLSGATSVVLTFEQYYRRFQCETFVEVSSNGTDWTSYPVNAALTGNQSTTNPSLAQVNITAAAAGESEVWIRFRFQGGCDYAWMVDDVAIEQGVEYDLAITNVWHGNVFTDWEYAMIPLSQSSELIVGVATTNDGGATQSNVLYSYDITLEGTSVASGDFSADNAPLIAAGADTTFFSTGFTPAALGLYTVTVTVSGDQDDENPENNSGSSSFELTEYEWAHERQPLWDGEYGGYIEPESTPPTTIEYAHGVVYVPTESATLYAIKVSFGDATGASAANPLALIAEVHTLGANIQEIVESEIQAVDISGTGWSTFVLDNPVFMEAGTGYTLAVRVSAGDVMTINGWGIDEDFSAANFGPFGQGGALNWYNGWGYSSAIRAILNPVVSIAETVDLTGIQMFPNPVNDALTVRFNAQDQNNVRINMVSLDGKLVYSENVKSFSGQHTSRIDMNGLPSGIYSVQLMSNNSTHTQKVVVVK